MSEKAFVFETDCVSCPGPDAGNAINEMKEQAREVTLRTFRKHCRGFETYVQEMGYARNRYRGLTIGNDWAVSFHKSKFRGVPCYYMEHSAIEHIWTQQGNGFGEG